MVCLPGVIGRYSTVVRYSFSLSQLHCTTESVSGLLSDLWTPGHNFEPTVQHFFRLCVGQLRVLGAPLSMRKNVPMSKQTPMAREREDPEEKRII